MGLYNNRSEGNYVKSYSMPSTCKDEKAHFDTTDNVHELKESKSQPKPQPKATQKPEHKPAPKVEVKPEPKPAPKLRRKAEQESKTNTDFSQRQKTTGGVPPYGRTQGNTPDIPQRKGCFNMGKMGCAIIIFIFFGMKKCVDSITSSFSYDSNDDIEVVYDTALYDFDDEINEEYIVPEDTLDDIYFDDI